MSVHTPCKRQMQGQSIFQHVLCGHIEGILLARSSASAQAENMARWLSTCLSSNLHSTSLYEAQADILRTFTKREIFSTAAQMEHGMSETCRRLSRSLHRLVQEGTQACPGSYTGLPGACRRLSRKMHRLVQEHAGACPGASKHNANIAML